MFRPLIALNAIVAVLLFTSGAARAETSCRDLENCKAVTDLAGDLAVKPIAKRSGSGAPSGTPPPQSSPTVAAQGRTPRTCSANETPWPRLKPKVVAAAAAVVELSRCDDCETDDVRALQELWARAMVRYVRTLSCAFDASSGPERSHVVEELRRVFSGAMVAGAGDSTALLALLQKEQGRSNTSLSEVLELYERLQDPATRKAFIQRLHEFGSGDSGLTQRLEALGTSEHVDQDLLDVLLKAERASLAMGLSFVTEREARARRVRGVRGLQLVVQKNWASASVADDTERSAQDFTNGIKQLLTVVTTEAIRRERQTFGAEAGTRELCACAADVSCKAVLLIQLSQTSTTVQPTGELHFREDVAARCSASPNDAKTPERIAGPAFEGRCRETETPSECANGRLKAAAQLLNRLSSQFSLFGDIAFLPVERQVEAISPTFHPGVSINEMPIPPSRRAPDLLRRGLRVENRGCDARLHDRVLSRLGGGYEAQIGTLGSTGRARLELTSPRPNACVFRLRDTTNAIVYGFVVQFADATKVLDAGDDAGRTVGQFYYNLKQAEYLAAKSRPAPVAARASAASSLFVAGTPFLVDAVPTNDGFGWLYAGLDTVGLLCGGVFAALSVNARNHAETGRDEPFAAAQSYLGVAYGCLGASLLSRAASALHYSVAP